MHPFFTSFIDMSIFLFTEGEQLKKIRQEADLVKRNYSLEFSKKIAVPEFRRYKLNIEPYKKQANYHLFLETKWKYKLLKMG